LDRSFGILLAAHGDLAHSLLRSLEMLMGPQPSVETVGLFPGMGREEMRAAIEQKLAILAGCDGVVIVADLAGGTPANVAAELVSERPDLHVVGGANLAFLCELCVCDGLDEAVIADAIKAGHIGLHDVGAKVRALLRQLPKHEPESSPEGDL